MKDAVRDTKYDRNYKASGLLCATLLGLHKALIIDSVKIKESILLGEEKKSLIVDYKIKYFILLRYYSPNLYLKDEAKMLQTLFLTRINASSASPSNR